MATNPVDSEIGACVEPSSEVLLSDVAEAKAVDDAGPEVWLGSTARAEVLLIAGALVVPEEYTEDERGTDCVVLTEAVRSATLLLLADSVLLSVWVIEVDCAEEGVVEDTAPLVKEIGLILDVLELEVLLGLAEVDGVEMTVEETSAVLVMVDIGNVSVTVPVLMIVAVEANVGGVDVPRVE